RESDDIKVDRLMVRTRLSLMEGKVEEAEAGAKELVAPLDNKTGTARLAFGLLHLAESFQTLDEYASAGLLARLCRGIAAANPDTMPEVDVSAPFRLAWSHFERAHYAEAETGYLKTKQLAEERFGPRTFWVGLSLGGLGSVYTEQARFTDAEQALVQS